MKATVSEPESWKRIIDIEIPEQEVQSAFDQKLSSVKKDMKLPGFRPGKVPETLIKQRFGQSIRAEIIDDLVQKSFDDACKENKIIPVSAPKVTNIKAPEGDALSCTIETQIDPVIEIKDYNKLKIKSQPKKIKDSDVDDAIKNLQDRFAEFKDVDRPAKKGDYVKLEYLKVEVDGVERTDITFPKYPVELGAENRIKDFDKGIIGHNVNETIDLTVKFPKDYADTEVAGKEGHFEIKILSVQEKVLAEINEEFLKKIGNIKDESDLRQQIMNNLEQESVKQAKNEAYGKAIETLIENNPFDVPPARIEQFIDYMYNESLQYKRPDAPVPSREEVAENYKDVAIKTLKRQRIIDFIADKENIKATSEEVDKEIQHVAEMYNQPFDLVKQEFRKNGTTLRIRDDIKDQKTLDFLIGEYTPENKE